MKQPQSSNDNKTTGADGESHLDVSLEEEEVSDLSPKKSLEIGDGSTCKLDEEPWPVECPREWAFIGTVVLQISSTVYLF